MIREVASILIKPGTEQQFEQAFKNAIPLFRSAHGCHSVQLERSIEDPLRYLLLIGWNSLEDHVVGFRSSDGYRLWRELVGSFFAAPPSVDHTELVIVGF